MPHRQDDLWCSSAFCSMESSSTNNKTFALPVRLKRQTRGPDVRKGMCWKEVFLHKYNQTKRDMRIVFSIQLWKLNGGVRNGIAKQTAKLRFWLCNPELLFKLHQPKVNFIRCNKHSPSRIKQSSWRFYAGMEDCRLAKNKKIH